MHWKSGEIFFNNRKEMLVHRPWIRELGEIGGDEFVSYQCARCGMWFCSTGASTDTGAIICGVCEKEVMK